jgi:hypothetical protein
MDDGSRELAAVTDSTSMRASLGTVTVAGGPSLDVPPGTLNAILKQAGVGKEK